MAAAPKPDRSGILLAALLQPTIGMMLTAGISRMSIARDKSVVLQMVDGETLTIEAMAQPVSPPPPAAAKCSRCGGSEYVRDPKTLELDPCPECAFPR